MVHVVADAEPVWAIHRADVRGRIIEAYLDRLDEPGALSMPAVARRAGVSVRTLYRYFPSKDGLQLAAAGWLDRRSREAMGGRELDVASLHQYMRMLWAELAAELPAVRAQHATPEGRALRAARLPAGRAQVERALPAEISGERRAEVVDLIVAVASSSTLLELVDRMGHDPQRAADLVADLIELIVTNEARRPPTEEGSR